MSINSLTESRKLIPMLLALFLIGILTTGCETTRTLPEWQGKPTDETAVHPIQKCRWPDWSEAIIDGETVGYLDRAGLLQMRICRDIAVGNHDLAEANADALDSLISAYNGTQRVGQQQTELAEYQLQALERDRRDASIEAWTYKGLLALVLIATAL